MAGNFILLAISQNELSFLTHHNGVMMSGIAHPEGGIIDPKKPDIKFQGWTVETVETLDRYISGGDIGNREHLPPHVYLELSNWNKLSVQDREILQNNLNSSNLTDRLIRNRQCKSISSKAKKLWDEGSKEKAIMEELKHGNVSIEIYYISGMQVQNYGKS